MDIIEYFASDRKAHWQEKLRACDWSAGQFLCDLLENGTLRELTGEHTRLLMLVDGDELVSFCTLADEDDVPDTDLSPWVGFVYTFPIYRGHRHFGKLLTYAETLARQDGHKALYISTDHVGLYERYGCQLLTETIDRNGEATRVYVRHL